MTDYGCSFYECEHAKEISKYVSTLKEALAVECHFRPRDRRRLYINTEETPNGDEWIVLFQFIILIVLTLSPGICWLGFYFVLLKRGHL